MTHAGFVRFHLRHLSHVVTQESYEFPELNIIYGLNFLYTFFHNLSGHALVMYYSKYHVN